MRKAWRILYSRLMMIYHVIHTVTRHIAPFGVSRDLESRHTVPIGVLVLYVAARLSPPIGVLILFHVAAHLSPPIGVLIL